MPTGLLALVAGIRDWEWFLGLWHDEDLAVQFPRHIRRRLSIALGCELCAIAVFVLIRFVF
jgi:hypothetical protein